MDRTTDQDRRQLDPARTRAQIMEAALARFAERGYSGASIGDIAAGAGVPKSLVQYHFGSKSKLWQSCLQHRAGPMIAAMDGFLSGQGTIEDLLKARIRIHEEHPELSRLLAWASIEPVPLPTFIQERREAFAGQLLQQGGPPQVAKVFAAIASIDGWYLFRTLYRTFAGGKMPVVISQEELLRNAMCVVGQA